jgi:hypothetical protein
MNACPRRDRANGSSFVIETFHKEENVKRTRCAVAMAAAFLFVAYATVAAHAQSVCSQIKQYGDVLTVGQWQQCFSAKQDGLGYTPVNQANGVMTGRLVTAASTSNRAGFGIPLGIAPSSPVDGDMWLTTSGIFVQVNGSTVGPLASSASLVMLVGTTSIGSGVDKGLLYNSAGKLGNLSTANNGVLVTNGSGVPSISSTLPSSLTIPSATFTGTPLFTGLSGGTCANGLAIDSSNNVVKITCPSVASSVQVGATGVGSATGTDYLLTTGTVSGGNGTLANVAQGYGNSISSGALNVGLTAMNNSLGSDVAMNNTANYFTGPTVAQGTTGTWLAMGSVSVVDTSGSAQIYCKLWDGTNLISSGRTTTPGTTSYSVVALSGFITNPAGNIRISCRDSTSTSGVITFSGSSNSKDATLSAVRIQ